MNDLISQRLAMKLLLPEYRDNREESGYLRHEFQVGCKLDHPRVIRMVQYGTDHGDFYLAMELFAAPNIKQHIHQGVDQIAPIVNKVIQQAAEGLAYFHAQGWVHRDIKPDNFLMDPSGEVKLIDFALARRQASGLARLFGGRSGKIQGTRSYMSPEQIRGKALDQRADIYSFGCMLHELVGGKVPFTGNSTNDLLMKHLRSAPPPLQASNRNVTDDFANLVKRLIAKDPKARPATLDEFLTEFRGLKIFKQPPQPVAKDA